MFSLCLPPAQYFETDDQEFYKTKVCFILNNDVSEMDLVFAEEKYSKSGQLEKVRQRFGKEHPPPFFFIADVISQAIRAVNLTKRDHIGCLASILFFLKSGEQLVYIKMHHVGLLSLCPANYFN